jgi:hypothetical protein
MQKIALCMSKTSQNPRFWPVVRDDLRPSACCEKSFPFRLRVAPATSPLFSMRRKNVCDPQPAVEIFPQKSAGSDGFSGVKWGRMGSNGVKPGVGEGGAGWVQTGHMPDKTDRWILTLARAEREIRFLLFPRSRRSPCSVPCSLPVTSLFVPCSELGSSSAKAHGIRV